VFAGIGSYCWNDFVLSLEGASDTSDTAQPAQGLPNKMKQPRRLFHQIQRWVSLDGAAEVTFGEFGVEVMNLAQVGGLVGLGD
jgi:hypothetical protein